MSKKLPENENLWLKSLTNDLEIRNLNAILEKGKQRKEQTPLGTYLDVIFRANNKVFTEVLTMYAPTLEQMLTEAGVLPIWEARWEARGEVRGEARGKAEGIAEGKAEVVRNLLAMNMPVEMIARAVQMPVENIHALASGVM